jgi:molybdenum cofactor cytidylyltransferase
MIGGIVLAAGLSERMGGPLPKQLLRLAGRPLVAISVGNAVASLLDEVVVVTGHRGDEVAEAIADLGAIIAPNPDYREGNMTSLRAGYAALPDCEAYVVLLSDMPGVTTEMIDRMVGTWRSQRPWAAIACYSDGVKHPLLLSRDAMVDAVKVIGPKAVWRFLESAPAGSVANVDFPQTSPTDVNTSADYERLLAE